MLFLVISTPRSSRMTEEVIAARLAFRSWIRSLKKQVVCFYPRKGRGSIVIFNLPSAEYLERIRRKWMALVQAKMRVTWRSTLQ